MSRLTRRNFLAAGAAGTAAAFVPQTNAAAKPAPVEPGNPAALKSAAQFREKPLSVPTKKDLELSNTFSLGKSTLDENEVITASRWGVVRAHVQGGKLTHLTPFEHDYAPSVNMNGLCELPYSSSRIRYPMVREGYLRNGPASREHRGEEKFVRVSWETALDLVAKEMNRVYDAYGPSAVFGRSYGWMSTGKVNAAINLQQRLLNLRGGFIQCINSYSTAAISRILPYVVGTGDPRSTSWDVVMKHSERVVLWGCDPIVTNDIDWLTTLHNSYGYFRALKEKGTKTIAINPLKPDTAEYLVSEWIAPRPGTDCAMMLGMLHELVRTKKADTEFLTKCCSGWPELHDYITGKTDGVEKTPAWAARECGVPAERIVSLTHELQEHRTMIMMGWGIQRIQYGEQSHWMGFALAAALGQIGLPGGGIGTNYHYCNGGYPPGTGPQLGQIPSRVPPAVPVLHPWKGSRAVPVARMADVLAHPGKVIAWNGSRIEYPDVHLVFWAGGNPFAHHPDTRRLEEAWRRPDAVIVAESFWNATARHADIILPASTFLERTDITPIGTYINDGIVLMKQAIDPIGNSRSDYAIFSALARRLGLEEPFTEGMTEAEWIRKLYEDARSRSLESGLKTLLPEWEDFEKAGVILYPHEKKNDGFVAFADFRRDPEAHPLKTETGKIVLYSERIASLGYADCPPHPAYLKPYEAYGNAEHAADVAALRNPEGGYLQLVSPKSDARLHSQLNAVTFRKSQIAGREICLINPADASLRNIATGDVIRVSSLRGAILAGAFVTDSVRPGAVVVHHGGWFDPQKVEGEALDVHGSSNVLTPDDPASSLSCGNIASTALVQVSKWTGTAPEVKVFEPPEH